MSYQPAAYYGVPLSPPQQQPQQQQQQQQYQQQQQQQQQQRAPVSRPPPPAAPGSGAARALQQNKEAHLGASVYASIQRDQAIVVPMMTASMMDEFNERVKGLSLKHTSSNPFDESTSPVRNHAGEAAQLVGLMVGYLRRRRDAGEEAPSLAELGAQVLTLTGQGWAPYWQPLHGPLLEFVRQHPGQLSVVGGRFVALRGFEHEVRFDAPGPALAAQQQQQQQPPPRYGYEGYPPAYGLAADPFGYAQDPYAHLSQQQQQQQPPQAPDFGLAASGGFAPYDAATAGGGGGNPFAEAIPLYEQEHALFPNVPFPHGDVLVPPPAINPYAGTADPTAYYASVANPYEVYNPYASAAAGARGTPYAAAPAPALDNDEGWVLFGDTAALNPFDENGLSGAPKSSAWGVGPAAAAAAEAAEEEARAARKAAKKAAKVQHLLQLQEQESADEALARALQEEEDALSSRAAGPRAAGASAAADNDAVPPEGVEFNAAGMAGDCTTRVALTPAEVRELAELEVGKDNIRILAGFSVVKFGREGRPHQRKMWINSALTHLAWESAQFDGSHRGLELAKVTGVRIGEMTPTIKRSTKAVRKVQNLCLTLETNARTLDLQACSVVQRDTLAAALKKVVEFNHRHRPRRLDKYRTELYV
jgi:hypothetical protein